MNKIFYSYYRKKTGFGIELMIGPLHIDDLFSDLKKARETAEKYDLEFKDYDLNFGKQDDLEQKIIKVFAVRLRNDEEKNKEYIKKLKEAYNEYTKN